jgi:formylglycine-generating enzyme required for sulfatase activity
MFETPCTQALWMAVMDGNNPSHFQGADRPVEQVSHRDVLRFIQRLNRMKRGLGMTLPSEAQWEYACRAGTDDATYAGPALIKGKDNAGILNEIAWWGGNSGSETHAVGQKQPNSWGLHDMLGNVWEWCADAWHENHDGVAFDGGPRDGGSAAWRVFRGGSWIDDARDVRAAGRRWGEPGDRLDDLGFRCARGLSVSTARSERRDAGPGKRRERSDQVAGARTTRRAGGAS